MDWLGFIIDHWDRIMGTLTALGVVVGAVEIRRRTEEERRRNESRITDRYLKLWSLVITEPSLSRIEDETANLSEASVTLAERVFVRIWLAHLNDVYRASKKRLFIAPRKLSLDVRDSFTLPILKAVWGEVREFQDADFATFVDGSIDHS